ncbi:MAG: hypothetical protein QUU85_01260 [Candidatus Eisenbacteria bacterium]|nr:hypothetical protein [Candidatus Eisenbacteria bacterium]
MNNEGLRRLRSAVIGRDREVEVDPDGKIREVTPTNDPNPKDREQHGQKPTKLSARTFGR